MMLNRLWAQITDGRPYAEPLELTPIQVLGFAIDAAVTEFAETVEGYDEFSEETQVKIERLITNHCVSFTDQFIGDSIDDRDPAREE